MTAVPSADSQPLATLDAKNQDDGQSIAASGPDSQLSVNGFSHWSIQYRALLIESQIADSGPPDQTAFWIRIDCNTIQLAQLLAWLGPGGRKCRADDGDEWAVSLSPAETRSSIRHLRRHVSSWQSAVERVDFRIDRPIAFDATTTDALGRKRINGDLVKALETALFAAADVEVLGDRDVPYKA